LQIIINKINMTDFKSLIATDKLPQHVAIIMDGNGRWAKSKGKNRMFGHKQGVQTVRDITETAAELGIKYLTLYTFSTENWNRPAIEVNALMALLIDTVRTEIATLNKNNIKLRIIGDLENLPSMPRKAMKEGLESTKNNTRMTLVLALNYGSKWEILRGVRQLAEKAAQGLIRPEDITDKMFESELSTAGIPDPELVIRTSGETRLSNFLLWQAAYSEFYFTKTFWPDFEKDEFYKAIAGYQNKERRFGKTGEQVA
jgi:undecaprenyl diphosphate synthase